MVSDVEPMAFPSRNIGGEFVGKVSVAGLLPKLDAGAPYNRLIFGGGLRIYPEKIAEMWQNQPELHWLKCADPSLEGRKDSTTLQTV
jgi:hypothetical protein